MSLERLDPLYKLRGFPVLICRTSSPAEERV